MPSKDSAIKKAEAEAAKKAKEAEAAAKKAKAERVEEEAVQKPEGAAQKPEEAAQKPEKSDQNSRQLVQSVCQDALAEFDCFEGENSSRNILLFLTPVPVAPEGFSASCCFFPGVLGQFSRSGTDQISSRQDQG
jgi:hypothetical protein